MFLDGRLNYARLNAFKLNEAEHVVRITSVGESGFLVSYTIPTYAAAIDADGESGFDVLWPGVTGGVGINASGESGLLVSWYPTGFFVTIGTGGQASIDTNLNLQAIGSEGFQVNWLYQAITNPNCVSGTGALPGYGPGQLTGLSKRKNPTF
jgi:hypothetical protein